MPALEKSVLLDRILEAVRDGGGRPFLEKSTYPWDLSIEGPGEAFHHARVYISNVTHGGRPGQMPDEYRIQITTRPTTPPPGYRTLLLGWFEDEDIGVFAAFDPEFHRHPGRSPSVQIPRDVLSAAAAESRITYHERGNQEVAFAFPPELLLTYIAEQASLHAAASASDLLELIGTISTGAELPAAVFEALPPSRQRLLRTVRAYARESSFKRRVLTAYGFRCAICGCQLKLTDAAHIVPVSEPSSTDETTNGLALCALHHRAYDSGLIGVTADYAIQVSEARMDVLRAAQLDAGAPDFRQALGHTITLPKDEADRPRRDYLRRGLALRGWKEG